MISFYNDDDVKVPKLRRMTLKKWINLVAESFGRKVGNITYNFCSDETILQANRQFLEHDYYTDIITFDESDGNTINGDLLISLDTVKSNANKLSVDESEELHRVIIHGILHLSGLGDKTPQEEKNMRKEEDKALNLLHSMIGTNNSLFKQ